MKELFISLMMLLLMIFILSCNKVPEKETSHTIYGELPQAERENRTFGGAGGYAKDCVLERVNESDQFSASVMVCPKNFSLMMFLFIPTWVNTSGICSG